MQIVFHMATSLFLSGAICSGQEAEPVIVTKQPSVGGEVVVTGKLLVVGDARLGLTVSKPNETTTTQLPSLPPGIGFVVSELEKGGPADKAGILKNDLLWKMNEQMLVNEGQLAILLRLSMPGEEAVLSVFREGKAREVKVTLGESKVDDGALIRGMLNDSVMRRGDGAVRIVNVEQQKAALSNENGTAEVYRVEGGDAVRIVDTEGKLIFEGVVSGRPELSMVPEVWRRQVSALRRGLEHALSAKAAPMRQPRPRIVPPPRQVGK